MDFLTQYSIRTPEISYTTITRPRAFKVIAVSVPYPEK